MIMKIYASLNFHCIRFLSNLMNKQKNDAIYLTFDDGPEPGITEFILTILKKYNVPATFFCCGKNIDKYPDLVAQIQKNGHKIANHTDSHLNGLYLNSKIYYRDVENGAKKTRSILFRPPWGGINIKEYFHLCQRYKIILWDIVSNDTSATGVDVEYEMARLARTTKLGHIVLFHFVNKHAANTQKLLPLFIEMALRKGYSFDVLK